MRHRVAHRKLNRTMAHRKALRRNMAQSLFEHGQIRTTLTKAKDVRPFVERLITLARSVRRRAADGDVAGSLTARRQIHKLLADRSIVPEGSRDEYDSMSDAHRLRALRMPSGRRYRTGDPRGRLAFTGESVIHRLVNDVAGRFEDRPGGYTRIIRLADRRVGDHSALAVLQLVGGEEPPASLTRPGKSARRRRTDARYGAAVRAIRAGGSRPAAKPAAAEPAPVGDTAGESPEA